MPRTPSPRPSVIALGAVPRLAAAALLAALLWLAVLWALGPVR